MGEPSTRYSAGFDPLRPLDLARRKRPFSRVKRSFTWACLMATLRPYARRSIRLIAKLAIMESNRILGSQETRGKGTPSALKLITKRVSFRNAAMTLYFRLAGR